MNFNNNTFTLQIVHLHHLNFPLTLVDDPSYIEGNLLKLLYIYDVRHLNHSDMTGTSVQNLNLKNRNRIEIETKCRTVFMMMMMMIESVRIYNVRNKSCYCCCIITVTQFIRSFSSILNVTSRHVTSRHVMSD